MQKQPERLQVTIPSSKETISQLEKDRNTVIRLMQQPEGTTLLKYLRTMYDGEDLANADTHQTYFALGQRDVFKQLEFLSEREQTNE